MVNHDIPVILTREIGGTKVGEALRQIMLHEELLPITELLMVMAARSEHIENVIKPALKEKKWVICDRFIDSTLSYQGDAIGIDLVLKLHREIFADLMPDITFFIDLPYKISLTRAMSRGNTNKFERKANTFHERIYSNFKALSEKFNTRIMCIDGTLAPVALHNKIIDILGI